ncbi:aminotransferase-like domain-containing protein [Streptomyces sp. NPDC055186]
MTTVPLRVPPPGPTRHSASAGSSVVRDALALAERPEVMSFAGGLPAPELFDTEGIRQAYDRVLTESPGRVLQYAATEGDPRLREAVAARLTRRGLSAHPSDLLITTGAQQALSLIATTFLGPGTTVLVENPTYLAALQCFARAGARVVPVETDEHGIVPTALERLACTEQPTLLYLVPNFQNPTGHSLPLERRQAIARIGAARGLWIVEDDPYGEIRFRGEPLPHIASLPDAADRTLLLGSFSKVLAPGMRLGWLHAPASAHRACTLAKQAFDLHSSAVDQAAAARYLVDNDLDRRIDAACVAYRDRCATMHRALERLLPEGSRCHRPDGGMFLWVRLPEGSDTAALLPRALEHNVAYVPGHPFFASRPDPATLRLSFTTHPPAVIEEGIERLHLALRGVMSCKGCSADSTPPRCTC